MEDPTGYMEEFRKILFDQLKRHTGFRIQDIYKLIYQMSGGTDESAREKPQQLRSLLDCWGKLEKVQPGEPLFEVIDPKGDLLRVNLRVCKKMGKPPEILADIVQETAQNVSKDKKSIMAYWELLMEMAGQGQIPFSKQDLEDYLIQVGKRNFPMVSHSQSYNESSIPAYRVVSHRIWEKWHSDK